MSLIYFGPPFSGPAFSVNPTRTPLSRSKGQRSRSPRLWLAVLAGQHGHQVNNGSRWVYDVYRVTTNVKVK